MTLVEYFSTLEKASGTNAKIKVLQNASPMARELLKHTYEPLWTYNIKKIPWDGTGLMSLEECWHDVKKDLYNLQVGSLSGHTAKCRLAYLFTVLSYEDGELLKKILRKDLRAGISVTTINKAIPGLIIPFGMMLAKSFDGVMPPTGLYMSLKLDGIRARYKNNRLYTRNGHEIQGVQHVIDELPAYGSYDGELMIPGSNFQTASGALRSFENCPNAVYHIFDAPDTTFAFRHRLIELAKIVPSEHVQVVKHVLTTSLAKVDETYSKALNAGYEGLVLKTPEHVYQMKRSSDWLKMKAVQSVDAPVTGFFEGQGKYEGSLGGIVVLLDTNVAVKVGGGFSDAERAYIWAHQDEFRSKIAEVLYHEETPDGSLRHPRFKCWRSDKS